MPILDASFFHPIAFAVALTSTPADIAESATAQDDLVVLAAQQDADDANGAEATRLVEPPAADIDRPRTPDARARPVALPPLGAEEPGAEGEEAAGASPDASTDSAEGAAPSTTLAPSPLAFADLDDDAVVERVLSHIEELGAMEAAFVQTAPSGAVSTGQFYLRRPGQLRFDYDAPSPLLIVATQGNVYVQDAELDQTDLYPIRRTPLRFLLTKNLSLDDVDVQRVDRGADWVAVTMAARDDEAEGDMTVVFNAPDLSLDQWVVRDAQNGATVVRLNDVRTGVKLSNRLFRAPEAGGRFINN